MKWIGEKEIEDLALGATLLGSGGGGDPKLGKLMAIKAIRQYGPIPMLDPAELPDDAFIIPTAMMGAPTIMMEKIPNGDEALKSLRMLEKVYGKKAYATMAIECGGINSTLPFTVAAQAGIPIVNADGMGRAFPELHMETFHIHGVNGTPMALHNERGDSCLLKTLDNPMLEYLSRGVAVRFGGVAHIAEYAMSGADVKRVAIPGTLSFCMALGEAIKAAQASKTDPIEAIKEVTSDSIYGEAQILFRGRIVDVKRETAGGFVRGHAYVEGFDEYQGMIFEVQFQNENLIAKIDGRLAAVVPDLVSLLDLETGIPFTTEGLRYGMRVICLGIPSPEIMRSEAALEVWGPRCFGLDCDFVPLQELYATV
ncbi:MAG: DUF917 domain-containing protein [Parachlamydia sp.]|nr:DUF917 domain-containing protein [Parachlamydia sp.]